MLQKSLLLLLMGAAALPVCAQEAGLQNVSHFYGGAGLGAALAGAGTHTASLEGHNVVFNENSQKSVSQDAKGKVKPAVNLLLGYQSAINQTSYFWSIEGDILFLPTSDTLTRDASDGVNSVRITSETIQRFSFTLSARCGLHLQGWSPYITVGGGFRMRGFEWKDEDLSGGSSPIENSSTAFQPMLKAGAGVEIPLDALKVRLEYACGILMKKVEKSFEDRDGDKITQSFKASPSHRLTVGVAFPF